MVMKPQDYRWSSYHANGLGKPSMIITPHEQYMHLARNDAERREAYRALFRAHVDEALTDEIRDATNGNFVLGGRKFQAQIAKALGRRVTRVKRGDQLRKLTAKANGRRNCCK
jgi:putative transposase